MLLGLSMLCATIITFVTPGKVLGKTPQMNESCGLCSMWSPVVHASCVCQCVLHYHLLGVASGTCMFVTDSTQNELGLWNSSPSHCVINCGVEVMTPSGTVHSIIMAF